jgi:hypothetical protein
MDGNEYHLYESKRAINQLTSKTVMSSGDTSVDDVTNKAVGGAGAADGVVAAGDVAGDLVSASDLTTSVDAVAAAVNDGVGVGVGVAMVLPN